MKIFLSFLLAIVIAAIGIFTGYLLLLWVLIPYFHIVILIGAGLFTVKVIIELTFIILGYLND